MTPEVLLSLVLIQFLLIGLGCILLVGAHNKLAQVKRVEQDLRKLLLLYKTRSVSRGMNRR